MMAPTLPTPEADRLEARRARWWPVAAAALETLYGDRADLAAVLAGIERQVLHAGAARPAALAARDRAREAAPDWFQAPSEIGYSAYVDRFAGDLRGLVDRIPYLRELGITYFHPLPLSRPRAGDNDGGFAVADYLDVDPRLGTVTDLERAATALHEAGISLVLDVVCNHTADDHAWARAARAGDPAYRSFYHVLPDRAAVDAYAPFLIDVFPETAPGSFTWSDQMGGYVWTTFYPYQWDLNYANPAVFAAMLDVLLTLANRGADVFRLDSAPFLWKRAGTSCRNLPEAHLIVRAWRALLAIAAPGVLLKAEAIEQLADVLPFFGPPDGPGECDLAYNNGAMTALWAMLALGDPAPVRRVMSDAARRPCRGAWLNYVRCHDDVIWTALAPALSRDTLAHLSRFYAGEVPGSFARGARFQAEGDAPPSTNGMAADLVGAGDADGDGLARLVLLYAVAFALDGVPLIYMGDELALPGDRGYREDPARRGDGRWLQRPVMDWDRAQNRSRPGTREHAAFQALARLSRIRSACPALHAAEPARAVEAGDPALLAFERRRGGTRLLCLANPTPAAREAALAGGSWRDLLADGEPVAAPVRLHPWQVRWLVPV